MNKQDIRDFLANLTKKNFTFGDNDSLLKSKVLDSLMVAELIIYLEDHYQVRFEDDDLSPENLDSINAIINFLSTKGVA